MYNSTIAKSIKKYPL